MKVQVYSESLDIKEVLEKVDAYRGYKEPFQMDVKVTDYVDDSIKSELKLQTYVKDQSSSFLKYIYPPIDTGKILLMVDDNIWFYNKKLSKPLRLSPRQRLIGNVSNADVARANFSFDYMPKFKSNQSIGGVACTVIELTAKNQKVAYPKIILYVQSSGYKPVKGEFFSDSGRLLKEAYYTKFNQFSDRERLTKVEIIDGIIKTHKTIIEYSNYKLNKLPDSHYNPDFLPRIQ